MEQDEIKLEDLRKKLEEIVAENLNTDTGIEYPYDYQTDIFYLGEKNEISIFAAIKENFLNCRAEYWSDNRKNEKFNLINNFDLPLIRDENATVESAIYSLYDNAIERKYWKAGIVKEAIKNVAEQIPVILQREKESGIFKLDLKNAGFKKTLEIFYNYILNDAVIIEYENYAVMFTFGCDD